MEYDVKTLAIDFEFNRTKEPHVHPVSVSFRPYGIHMVKREGESGRLFPLAPAETLWLTDDTEAQEVAKFKIQRFIREGFAILSFGGIAEGRALSAIGIEPCSYPMFDLYVLFMQLKHTWHKYMYGRYVNQWGELVESTPPQFDRITGEKVFGDNMQILNSLSACVAHVLGRKIDTKHKDMIRNLIISDPETFSDFDKEAILRYNESDIIYLPELMLKMMDDFCAVTGLDHETAWRVMIQHGEYVQALADEEDTGIPIDVVKATNLGYNYELAKDHLIGSLCEIYPFYERAKPSGGELIGEWVNKYSNFERYLKETGKLEGWPRTEPTKAYPSGKLKTDGKTLKELEGSDEALKMLRQVSKSVNQMSWFNGSKESNILNYIGSDGRIRTWFAPFGTLTGRNAPLPSKGYIPAMAKWIRSLMVPPEGYVFIEPDWSSQEFIIAASLSGDLNMIEAYESGDPYVYFMKKVGAIPEDANNDWVKDPKKAPENLRADYEKYSELRDLGKSTVLGLQFQMGKTKLNVKLRSDTGKEVSRETSDSLWDFHHQLFKTYWNWVSKTVEGYHRTGVISLQDGWCLLPDNDSDTSTGNQPVQGTGACIFREATRRSIKDKIKIVFGLHDALRALAKVEENDDVERRLLEHMRLAVEKYLDHPIRNETKIITHDVPYVEKAAKAIYEKMKPYLETRMESDYDIEKRIEENLFGDME